MVDQQSIEDQIARFGADPRHPHFEEYRATMAELLDGGIAETLEEAYFLAARKHGAKPAGRLNMSSVPTVFQRVILATGSVLCLLGAVGRVDATYGAVGSPLAPFLWGILLALLAAWPKR